ncbi:uncharacterized protein BYT42DRAFT_48687 [Radiomyces spectabilis]|uniref:uncharacterized protein n=1 Tax=Radiomyces spectabilis TaxID=64574 RepID=UPI002221048E|nr:uncharacterized protein BYT42DRAFT_48687 [Radiomyces spectabilis]KAI8372851.1 hypothetical protein BYT42DRAFT_48687 [Radiomyces spectabilis]
MRSFVWRVTANLQNQFILWSRIRRTNAPPRRNKHLRAFRFIFWYVSIRFKKQQSHHILGRRAAVIFDLGKTKDICETYGLTFQHRISTNGKVAILQESLIHRRTYKMTSKYDRWHERKKASAKPAVQNDDMKNQINSLTDVIDGLQKRQKEIVTLRQSLQNEVKLAKGRFYKDRSDLNFRN